MTEKGVLLARLFAVLIFVAGYLGSVLLSDTPPLPHIFSFISGYALCVSFNLRKVQVLTKLIALYTRAIHTTNPMTNHSQEDPPTKGQSSYKDMNFSKLDV